MECLLLISTGPGGSTPKNSSYLPTYNPSRKLSKLDEPDMQETAGKAMYNREEWRERVSDIRGHSAIWHIYIYIYIINLNFESEIFY